VLLAGPRSFCAGVDRAIAIVEAAVDRFGPPVYVRRQIVHNTHVIARLEARGVRFVTELDDVPDEATVVIAAHGVSPLVRADADRRGLRVVDATCPLVAKVHHEVQRHVRVGRQVVLIGHDDHEEVQGTRGEAPDDVAVVASADEVAELAVDDPDRLAWVSQTTLATDETSTVVAALQRRFPAIVGPRSDDICYATQNRQEAVRAVAVESDLVVVVGSANSSNSNRLVEVARRGGADAVLVEDESDLDLDRLAAAVTIGVTAGASAPPDLVDRVVAAVATLGPVEVEERTVVEEHVRFPLPVEVR
jgi:4-hydroxy-3-methylbut-2-enyl diphosphate reductase